MSKPSLFTVGFHHSFGLFVDKKLFKGIMSSETSFYNAGVKTQEKKSCSLHETDANLDISCNCSTSQKI